MEQSTLKPLRTLNLTLSRHRKRPNRRNKNPRSSLVHKPSHLIQDSNNPSSRDPIKGSTLHRGQKPHMPRDIVLLRYRAQVSRDLGLRRKRAAPIRHSLGVKSLLSSN